MLQMSAFFSLVHVQNPPRLTLQELSGYPHLNPILAHLLAVSHLESILYTSQPSMNLAPS